MIRRINQVSNVGCFRGMRVPRLQFAPLTLIYGENCNGKSTLCDIFRSLSKNLPDLITNRNSIPPSNTPQNVQISFSLPNTENETVFTFNNNAWSNQLENINIMVFDTEFIHRNVFTGLTIERRNQENITEFILGEQSVESANRIADVNSTLRSVRREINRLLEEHFRGITDIDAFLTPRVLENEADLEQAISATTTQIRLEQSAQGNIQGIISRQEPVSLILPTGLPDFIAELNQLIQATFEIAHENALIEVQGHIQQNCNNANSADAWLNQGLRQLSANACPFCGQALTEASNKLIEMYRICFDRAFNEYTDNSRAALDNLSRSVTRFQNLNLSQRIHQNALAIQQYTEISNTEPFLNNLETLTASQQTLFELLETWSQEFDSIVWAVNTRIQEKREHLYASLEPVDLSHSMELFGRIIGACNEYNARLRSLIDLISGYKASLNAQAIEQRIAALNAQLLQDQTKRRRLQNDLLCRQLRDFRTAETSARNNLDRLNTELRNQQNAFLQEYFTEINRIFGLLGSNNFTIGQSISNRGNMPVVQVVANFHGIPVTNAQVASVFSESDRRALAFAIFWARITHLTEEDKQKTIVILDDPITSFDDGRIDRTIRMIETTRSLLRQVLIFCHYSNYVSSFYLWANNNPPNTILYSLRQEANGSTLVEANPANFTEALQQRKLRKIIDFTERRIQEDIYLELRVFLETEIRNRYWLQINRNNLGSRQFADLLGELRNLNALNETKWQNIDQLRQTLNVDHHIWLARTDAEKIGIANDVLTGVFEN